MSSLDSTTVTQTSYHLVGCRVRSDEWCHTLNDWDCSYYKQGGANLSLQAEAMEAEKHWKNVYYTCNPVDKHLLWRIVYGCPATIIKMRSFKKGKTCIKGCLAQSFQFRWLWSCEAYFVLLVWHTIIQNNYKYLTLFCCLRFNVASVRSSSLCCLLYDIFYQTEQSGIHIVSCKTWASAAVDVLQNFVNPRQLLSHTWCA